MPNCLIKYSDHFTRSKEHRVSWIGKTSTCYTQVRRYFEQTAKGEVKLNLSLMDGIILGYDTIKELLVKIETVKNEDVNTDSKFSSGAVDPEYRKWEWFTDTIPTKKHLQIQRTNVKCEINKIEKFRKRDRTQGRI